MKNQGHITCRELIEFLMEYMDGTLAPAQRAEFERHLAICPSCVNYLHGYAETVRLGKEACSPADVPAEGKAPESLLRAIREARAKGV